MTRKRNQLAPVGYDQISQFLASHPGALTGGAGNRRGGNAPSMNGNFAAQVAAEAQRMGAGNETETEWDKYFRPVSRSIDILTSLGYGMTNTIAAPFERFNKLADKVAEEGLSPDKLGQFTLDTIGTFRPAIADFVGGVGAAWAGDTKNLRTGADAIETITDSFGKANHPYSYEDTADNVNPWVKGIGGLVLDVGLDPLTYVPGGAILSAAKGGLKGATAAARVAETGKSAAFFKDLLTPARTPIRLGSDGKVVNVPLPFNEGARQGIADWSAARAARAVDKQALAAAKTRWKAGEHSAEDIKTLLHNRPSYVNKMQSDPVAEAAIRDMTHTGEDAINEVADTLLHAADATPAAEKVYDAASAAVEAAARAARSTKGTGRAGRVAEAAVDGAARIPGAKKSAAKAVVEGTVRERIAGQVDPAAAQFANAAGASYDEVQRFIKTITYEVPLRVKERDIIRGIPLPVGKGPQARAAWRESTDAIIGSKARIELERLKTDPEAFKAKLDDLAAGTVTQTYENMSKLLKGLNVKKQARVHSDEQLAKLADMLGMKRPKNWTKMSASDFLKRGNPQETLNVMKKAEMANRKAFAEADIEGGTIMEARAAEMERGEGLAQASNELLGHVDNVGAERATAYNSIFARFLKPAIGDLKKLKAIRISRQGERVLTTKKGKKTPYSDEAILANTWEQHKSLTILEPLIRYASTEAARLGLTGAQRAQHMTEIFIEGAKFLDLRLRSLGITPVSWRGAKEAKLLGNTERRGEVAFLGMSDVLESLPPELVRALFFEGHNLSVAMTTLHSAARWALKLSGDDMSHGDAMRVLRDMIAKDMKAMTKNGAPIASAKYAGTELGSKVIDALATTMLQPAVLKKLAIRNLEHGTAARNMMGDAAHHFSQPTIDALRKVLTSPLSTKGDVADAMDKAVKGLRARLGEAGISAEDVGVLAKLDLEIAIAQLATVEEMQAARMAIQMMNATAKDRVGRVLSDEARASAEAEHLATISGTTTNGKPKKPRSGPAKTETERKTLATAAAEANTVRASGVRMLDDQYEELADSFAATHSELTEGPDTIVAADKLRADLVNALPGWLRMGSRFAQKMSGSFGMKNLKPNEISIAISTRQQIHHFATSLNELRLRHNLMDDPQMAHRAWNILREMPDNNSLDAALEGVDEATAAFTRDLWPIMSRVFDHSDHNLFARAGLDPDYINGFLVRTGVPRENLLSEGVASWKVGREWTQWEAAVDSEFLADPLTMLMRYQSALTRATVVPDIAAAFSSQFGHSSSLFAPAKTRSEAIAAGWKRIKVDPKSDGMARFVDPDEYFPPEMIDEMARMDEYLATSRILDQDALFDKAFKQIDPIINIMKTSITLWRPGHHVTNIVGEFLFNTLAGVWSPARYADGWNILRSQGRVDGDVGDKLIRYAQDHAPEGTKLTESNSGRGITMIIGGKPTLLSYDSAWRLFDKWGIVIHHNVAEDLINESVEALGKSGGFADAAHAVQRAVSPQWLGQASASRDNVFRLTHAADILSKKSFRSLEEAGNYVAREVHSYHPNFQTLSAFEQKYMRRLFYFYTWQRQALSRVLESMIEMPGRLTMAPKAVYALSTANGVQPQSFGEPMPNDPRIPVYSQGNITSVLYKGGLQPFGETPEGQDNFLWGYTVNAPQLDVLQSIFGTLRSNPDMSPTENAGGYIGQSAQILGNTLTPALKVPAELLTGSRFGSGGSPGTPIRDANGYLLDQTGLGYPSRAGLFGPRADAPDTEVERQAKLQQTIFNWFTGAKLTNFTTPAASDRASRDRTAELRRLAELLNGGQ